MPVRVASKAKASKKQSINPFGWFKLERYRNLSLTSLQWYQQIALRQALVRYIAPRLVASEDAQQNGGPISHPTVIEESLLAQATSAWKKLKLNPVSADLQLLQGDLPDRLSGASSTGSLLKGVRNLTYADLAVAGYFCRELRIRGGRRTEYDAFSADPSNEGKYRQWMSEALYTGLTNKQFFGMLSVDLELPDKHLRQEFERWLTATRQKWRDSWKSSTTQDPMWMDDLPGHGDQELSLDDLAEMCLLPCLDLLLSTSENSVRLTNMGLANYLRVDGRARDQTVRSGVRQCATDLLTQAEFGLRMMRWLEERIATGLE